MHDIDDSFRNAQALLIDGFPERPIAHYYLFKITDPGRARATLRRMLAEGMIPSASREDKALRAERHRARVDQAHKKGAGEPVAEPETIAIVALTRCGLGQLTSLEHVYDLPPEFIEGMVRPHRARNLGDPENVEKEWLWSDACENLHGLFIELREGRTADRADYKADYLYGKNSGKAWNRFSTRIAGPNSSGGSGFALVRELPRGWIRRDRREHFGFRDGISQPYIVGSDTSRRPTGPFSEANAVLPGEFLLGRINESAAHPATIWVDCQSPAASAGSGNGASTLHHGWLASSIGRGKKHPNWRDLGRDGTFLAFRQMAQDVIAFEDFVSRAQPTPRQANRPTTPRPSTQRCPWWSSSDGET
ncbi:MAG: hypothetical protein R3E48_02000 [Burkholderiaceae bacterium]